MRYPVFRENTIDILPGKEREEGRPGDRGRRRIDEPSLKIHSSILSLELPPGKHGRADKLHLLKR